MVWRGQSQLVSGKFITNLTQMAISQKWQELSWDLYCRIYVIGSLTFFPGANDVRFSLRSTTYQNNSIVTLEDIGEDGNALLSITDNTACCGRAQLPGWYILGDWYYPNGMVVPNSVINAMTGEIWEFYRNRGPSVVHMHRRRGGVTGIYHCEIPDAMNVNQTIYIGVYTANTGEWCIYTRVLLLHFCTECLTLYAWRMSFGTEMLHLYV